jgi:hypothetical protein
LYILLLVHPISHTFTFPPSYALRFETFPCSQH